MVATRPFVWRIGPTGCTGDVAQANGTCGVGCWCCWRCRSPICCPVGRRVVGQVDFNGGMIHVAEESDKKDCTDDNVHGGWAASLG